MTDAGFQLTYSRAGHLPPLVIDADGQVTWLDEGRGTVLRLPDRGPRPAATTALPADATLLLVTDGLIERRDQDLDAGLHRLSAAAAPRCSAPLDALVDGLLADLVDIAGTADDIAFRRGPADQPRVAGTSHPRPPAREARPRSGRRPCAAVARRAPQMTNSKPTDGLDAAGRLSNNGWWEERQWTELNRDHLARRRRHAPSGACMPTRRTSPASVNDPLRRLQERLPHSGVSS